MLAGSPARRFDIDLLVQALGRIGLEVSDMVLEAGGGLSRRLRGPWTVNRS
ncbi:MAG: hypothetical protein H6519_04265 [Microthrixaceae bacterium]|nr:hypothetical protein [Microthrixaceae bacterium]